MTDVGEGHQQGQQKGEHGEEGQESDQREREPDSGTAVSGALYLAHGDEQQDGAPYRAEQRAEEGEDRERRWARRVGDGPEGGLKAAATGTDDDEGAPRTKRL